MQRAVFIDRDGVINDNQDHYYIYRVEDFQLNPGVLEALIALKARGFLLILISNQGGISRGLFSQEDVEELHDHLCKLLFREGLTLDEIYYCPHHHRMEQCLCRKPLPLMLQKAMAKFDIDPEQSYFIGDSEHDVEAGKAAGVKTILMESNSNLLTVLERIN